jgi:hypothetical protein
MRLDLYGGFGEKGRTCLGIESGGYRLLLDAGVKTSARGKDDYCEVSRRGVEASMRSHHPTDTRITSPRWVGSCKRIRRTHLHDPETGRGRGWRREHALPEDLALMRNASIERLPVSVDAVDLGPLRIARPLGHAHGGDLVHR